MMGRLTNTDECKNWKISDLKDNYIPYINELRRDGYRLVYIPNFFPDTYRCKDPKKIEQFHELLVNSFGLAEFESVQLLYDERYFYDSDYHLTTDGVALKTNIFESQLRSLLKSQ